MQHEQMSKLLFYHYYNYYFTITVTHILHHFTLSWLDDLNLGCKYCYFCVYQ